MMQGQTGAERSDKARRDARPDGSESSGATPDGAESSGATPDGAERSDKARRSREQ